MRGHGEKMTRRKEQCIEALLSQPTVEAAARAAGVSYPSLKRWLNEPTFKTAYAAARRHLVDDAIRCLQRVTASAVLTLYESLKSPNPGVRVRAAQIIIEQSLRGVEIGDQESRLAVIEGELKELTHAQHRQSVGPHRGASGCNGDGHRPP
jgi:hypothetical protein